MVLLNRTHQVIHRHKTCTGCCAVQHSSSDVLVHRYTHLAALGDSSRLGVTCNSCAGLGGVVLFTSATHGRGEGHSSTSSRVVVAASSVGGKLRTKGAHTNVCNECVLCLFILVGQSHAKMRPEIELVRIQMHWCIETYFAARRGRCRLAVARNRCGCLGGVVYLAQATHGVCKHQCAAFSSVVVTACGIHNKLRKEQVHMTQHEWNAGWMPSSMYGQQPVACMHAHLSPVFYFECACIPCSTW
jgi:hypothetical protein